METLLKISAVLLTGCLAACSSTPTNTSKPVVVQNAPPNVVILDNHLVSRYTGRYHETVHEYESGDCTINIVAHANKATQVGV